MAKFSKEDINRIIGLRGNDGMIIDVFRLHGVLYIGNTENGEWDLNKNYIMLSESRLPIALEDFEFCETEKDVRETFAEELKNIAVDKLL